MILLIYLYSISLELIGVFESITRNYSGQVVADIMAFCVK